MMERAFCKTAKCSQSLSSQDMGALCSSEAIYDEIILLEF